MTAPAPITQSTAELMREMRRLEELATATAFAELDALSDADYLRSAVANLHGSPASKAERYHAARLLRMADGIADADLAAADAASQPAKDEREAFEAWATDENDYCLGAHDSDYHSQETRNAWWGWMARASLAQPPAQPVSRADELDPLAEALERLKSDKEQDDRLWKILVQVADKHWQCAPGESEFDFLQACIAGTSVRRDARASQALARVPLSEAQIDAAVEAWFGGPLFCLDCPEDRSYATRMRDAFKAAGILPAPTEGGAA